MDAAASGCKSIIFHCEIRLWTMHCKFSCYMASSELGEVRQGRQHGLREATEEELNWLSPLLQT